MATKMMFPTRREMLQQAGAGALLAALPAASSAQGGARNVNGMLEPIRKSADLPALAALTLKAGKVTALGTVGVRKIGDRTPATVQDKFHLGSCTKAMTAHLCAILMEEGRLHRTTLLKDALPDMAARMHPAYRHLTLDHLLAQRTGFSGEGWLKGRDFQELRRFPGSPLQQREAYLHAILQEAPEAEPGKKYIYSNRNYAVAGVLAERAAGEAWEQAIQHKLFHRLDIRSAGFGAMGTPGQVDQPWQHVVPGWNGEARTVIGPGPNSDNPSPIAPAGTVHMSLQDWAKFVQDHLSGLRGEGGTLKAASYRYLHTPLFGGEYMGGWIATERPWGGGRVYTHAGSNTQNYAVVWMAPLKNCAALVMTNQGGDAAAQACDQVAAAMILTFLT